MQNKETSIVTTKPRLRKGQAALYELILKQTKNDKPILYSDALHIWINLVSRNVINGHPHYFNIWHHKNEKDEWVAGYTPYSQEQIRQALLVWVMNTIGGLVFKGYLKVIPQIELAELS